MPGSDGGMDGVTEGIQPEARLQQEEFLISEEEWLVGMPVVLVLLFQTFLGHQYQSVNLLSWFWKKKKRRWHPTE